MTRERRVRVWRSAAKHWHADLTKVSNGTESCLLESQLREVKEQGPYWDPQTVKYRKFCKAYYVNLVLSNKLQQVLTDRAEILNRFSRAAGIMADHQRFKRSQHGNGYHQMHEQKQQR